MNDDNQYYQYTHESTTAPFQVHGHEVSLLSPLFARVTIKCPFARTNTVSLEQREFVMNQTQSVVNYMMKEGFLSAGGGIGIMVLTSHP